jgi:hypothetical protein
MKPTARSKVFHIYPQTSMLKKEVRLIQRAELELWARSTAITAHPAMQLLLATSLIKK